MQNTAFKMHEKRSLEKTPFSLSVSQSEKTPCLTLKTFTTKDWGVGRHQNPSRGSARTQEEITNFMKINALESKIKIHAPEYLETMTEHYAQKDISFFEHLVLVCAFFRVGSQTPISQWFWTEEEDFLEAWRMVKEERLFIRVRKNPLSNPQKRMLKTIQKHFKNQTFNAKMLLPYFHCGSTNILIIISSLRKIGYIAIAKIQKCEYFYQLNPQFNF